MSKSGNWLILFSHINEKDIYAAYNVVQTTTDSKQIINILTYK